MNIQNLANQLKNSTNPLAMMLGMLNPNQKQTVNQMQNKTREEQANEIASLCNSKGISKEDLQNIMKYVNGN